MSEKKKQDVPQEAKANEGTNVGDLKKQLDNACAQLRRVTAVMRTQFGMDLEHESDSRTAKVNWLLLPVVAVAGLIAVTFAAMGDQSYEDGGTKDLAHWGKAKITSDGTFKTDGSMTVGGALVVSGSVTYSAVATNILSIIDSLYVGTNLTVTNATSLRGAVAIGRTLVVTGDVTCVSNITAATLNTTGAGTIGRDFTVTGNAVVTSNMAAKTLSTTGAGIIGGNLTASNDVTINKSLMVTGEQTNKTNIRVEGNQTLTGSATISSNVACATFSSTGAGIVGGNLTASNDVAINKSLMVTGVQTNKTNIRIEGIATITGNGVISSNVAMTTFNSSGAGIVGAGLTVTGAVSTVTNVTVGGNLILSITEAAGIMTMPAATNAPVMVSSNSPVWLKMMIGTDYFAVPGYELP